MGGPHRIPLETRLPVGPVNCYLLDGDPLTLVDAGVRIPGAIEALEAGIHASGHRLEEVEVLFLTHAHVDHYGLAAEIRRRSGARVLAHAADRGIVEMTEPEREARWRSYGPALREAGVPEAELAVIASNGERLRRLAEPCGVDASVAEGDRLRLGGREWRVLHAPGHSPGSVGLHDEATGDLVSGDVILERVTSNAISVKREEQDALVRHLESLERLAALPIRWTFPGHGPPFEDGAAAASRAIRHTLERAARVEAILEKGPLTPREVADALFLGRFDVFLAISETLGHLRRLVTLGRAREIPGPVARFGIAGN